MKISHCTVPSVLRKKYVIVAIGDFNALKVNVPRVHIFG